MSAYRQWRLPSEIGILNSGSLQAQLNRYQIMCNQVNTVAKIGKDLVILTGNNINSLEDNSFSSIYRNVDIKGLKDNMIIQNSLVIHNNKPTFKRQGLTHVSIILCQIALLKSLMSILLMGKV